MLGDKSLRPQQRDFHGLGQRFFRLPKSIFHISPVPFTGLQDSRDRKASHIDPACGGGAGQTHELTVLFQGVIDSSQCNLCRRHTGPSQQRARILGQDSAICCQLGRGFIQSLIASTQIQIHLLDQLRRYFQKRPNLLEDARRLRPAHLRHVGLRVVDVGGHIRVATRAGRRYARDPVDIREVSGVGGDGRYRCQRQHVVTDAEGRVQPELMGVGVQERVAVRTHPVVPVPPWVRVTGIQSDIEGMPIVDPAGKQNVGVVWMGPTVYAGAAGEAAAYVHRERAEPGNLVHALVGQRHPERRARVIGVEYPSEVELFE